jgi:hypothetical protein
MSTTSERCNIAQFSQQSQHQEYCIKEKILIFCLQICQNYFECKTGVCKRSSLSADTIGILPDL